MLIRSDESYQLFGKTAKANMLINTTTDGSIVPVDKLKKQKTQIWDSVINVILIEGKNLSPKDENGLSDPFVKLKMGTEKCRSKVCNKTLNPKWNEQFTLHSYAGQSKVLELTVYDKDAGKDEKMGWTRVDIGTLTPERNHDIVKELEGGEGRISLVITVSGTLTTGGDMSDLTAFEQNFAQRQMEIQRKYVSPFSFRLISM